MKRRNHIFLFFLLLTLVLCLGLCSCREEEPMPDPAVLPSPTGFSVADDVLSWEPVEGAASYLVFCEGEEYKTKTNSLDIFCIADRPNVDFSLTVMSKGDGILALDSPVSEPYVYRFTASSDGIGFRKLPGDSFYTAYVENPELLVGKIYIPGEFNDQPVGGIMDHGFRDCTEITGVVMHNNIEVIGTRAFSGCTSLQRISLPWTMTTIGDFAFLDCTALAYAQLPENLSDIAGKAFQNCTSLSALEVSPKNPFFKSEANCLIKRSDGTLMLYAGDGSGVLPDAVRAIGDYVFYQSPMETVLLHEGITKIGDHAFSESAIRELCLPSTLISIGDNAFSHCKGISKIILGGELEQIGKRAFYECSSATFISISNSVFGIGDEAFGELGHATVMLSCAVSEIGACAFSGASVSLYTDYNVSDLYNWPMEWGTIGSTPWKAYDVFYCANCKFETDEIGALYVSEVELQFRDFMSPFNDGPYLGERRILNTLFNNAYAIGILDRSTGISVPIREGYTFLGWAKEKEGRPVLLITDIGNTLTTQDLDFYRSVNVTTTLYAVWEKN